MFNLWKLGDNQKRKARVIAEAILHSEKWSPHKNLGLDITEKAFAVRQCGVSGSDGQSPDLFRRTRTLAESAGHTEYQTGARLNVVRIELYTFETLG